MTGKKFLLYSFLQLIIFTLLKIWFFNSQIFANSGIQQIAFWAVLVVISAALIRRMGIMNYLESFFTIIVWFLAGMLLDLIITSAYTGLGIFYRKDYWAGFLVMAIAVFLFHKKRHVYLRHDIHAGHGGHSHWRKH